MVRASKISIPKINKNFKAAISENKMEEVVIDNTDYDDVAQFEALDNFGKDPVSNNVEEESWSTLNYSDLKDILENRMLNDNMNIVQKMLKKQFTEATGLQDPLRELGLNFQVYRSIPFVQVFQDSRMH